MTVDVQPRETRTPEFPAVVHTYTDLLRALRDDGPAGPDQLADATGRIRSNVRRDIHKLLAADVICRDGGGADKLAITDKGCRWVDGADVAEGRAQPAGGLPRWPIDRLRPNPANRPIDPETIPDLADSIAAEGLLQPLLLSPEDDMGVRTIWAGERRWQALCLLQSQDRLPPDLSAAPFLERHATAEEAKAITLIENTERQGLTPLEEAFILRDLADAWEMDAKTLAERLGRTRQLRSIQQKIKIAREATVQALAAYRANGSWDALVASVQQRREAGLEPAANLPAIRAASLGFDRADDLDVAWSRLEPDTWAGLQLPNAKASWKGMPDASVQVAKVKGHEVWANGASVTTPSGGFASNLNGVWGGHQQLFPTREAALADAIQDVMAYPGVSTRTRRWCEAVIASAGDPEKVGAAMGLPAALVRDTPLITEPDDAPPEPIAQPTGPYVLDGVDYHNATRYQEARYAKGYDKRPHPGGSSRPSGSGQAADAGPSNRAALALVELAHKVGQQRLPLNAVSHPGWTGDAEEDFTFHGAKIARWWEHGEVAELQGSRLIEVRQFPGGLPALAVLTPEGVRWLLQAGVPLPVTEGTLQNRQILLGGQAVDWRRTYHTEWLQLETGQDPEPAAQPPALSSDPPEGERPELDVWGRDHNEIVADQAVLEKAKALDADSDGAALASALGLIGPFSAEGDAGVHVRLQGEAAPGELITVDLNRKLPEERAQAIAHWVAWALNRAIDGGQG